MYTKDFLIGAIRASNDLHPQVKTELEEILNRAEPVKPKKVTIRDKILERDLDYDVCGNCGSVFYPKVTYCQNCGRPVDWT